MTFHQFYSDLLKKFRNGLWLTSALAAGVSVCAVGLLGLSGWFLTGAALAGAAGPILSQAFNYLLPSAFIRFFAIARTGFRYGERYLGHRTALNAMAELRPALLERVLGAPPETALSLSRGEASGRFVQDVGTLETALVAQSAPASALGGIIVAVAVAAWCNPLSALVVLGSLSVATLIALGVNRRDQDETPSEQQALGDLKAHFFATLAVLPDIRSYDVKAPLLTEFGHLEDRLREARLSGMSSDAVVQAISLVFLGFCLIVLAAINIDKNLADLALSLLAASAGFDSFTVLLRAVAQQKTFATARARVASLFDLKTSSRPEGTASFQHDGATFALDGKLRLHIDGRSGSGKTHLIETLIGLRGQDEGPPRRLFAYCPQDAALLSGTLRENLAMASGETVISTDAMWQALDDASLKARVAALPKGLDTWVGDGGVALSGGERKRLALARAYLRPAPILVLDEPTEGLDLVTEAFVIDRLKQRLDREGQGLILVSHREAPRRLASQTLKI